MLNIVFDARVHLNYYSGISRYIICLLEAYANQFPQDKITVLLNPTIQPDNNIYKTLQVFSNIEFKTIDAGHMGPKNYTKMGEIVKNLAPDVYHYPHLDAPIFTGKIPVVATIHDSNSNNKIKKFDDRFGLKSVYFKQAIKSTLKRSNHVVFVSDSIKTSILNDFKVTDNPDKFSTIHNGFEPNFGQISADEIQRQLADVDHSAPYILFVGQIREHKNIYRSIEAFKKFNQTHPAYKLIIVGHNYLNLNLIEENIRHFDSVSNKKLKALYSQCKAFLFPSLFEGFGFPILEAFSFGKPVITSNYGATKEISNDLAILVDPLSVDAIAKGIEKALLDESRSAERKAMVEKYSWEKNAAELRQVYLKAANR